jgi:hypothetical protein
MKFASSGLAVTSALLLCACWNGKSQFRQYMDEGHAQHLPIVIYDISANDPHHLYSEPVGVGFVNTDDQEIASVVLTVKVCGIKADTSAPWTLNLGGPFEPNASFVISPVTNPDAEGKQYPMVLPHVVISRVVVVDAAGTHTFEGKDVTGLLDRRIANFCAGDVI